MTATASVAINLAAEPSASIRKVTPEMAATWLAANTHNRKLRDTLVDRYAREMAAGRWMVNGEAIQISRSGVLINGQHRLAAIVESGTTQQMLVVTNIEGEAQATVDTGAKRSVGDVLNLAGYAEPKNLASIVKFGLEVANYPKLARPTPGEIQAAVEDDKVAQWVAASVLPTLPKLAAPTPLGYVYLRLHHVDPDACATFFSKLATLDKLPENSPILVLHKKFAYGAKPGGSFKARVYTVTCFFLAWNAWRKGEGRSQIKPYPTADGYYNIPEPA